MRTPDILGDEKYRECIELALQSKGARERYGAILLREGEIIGRGYNRSIAHAAFPGIRLERVIRQGYANHAEVEAINDALLAGRSVSEAVVYVAGYFPSDNRLLFLHETFTCDKCAKIMNDWGIRSVYVPSVQGWIERPIEVALEEAGILLRGEGKHESRRNLIQGSFSVHQMQAP